ncbi:MAG: hypothetical protein IT310_12140 [Anaerolineales bacterium]|nr:hypothetical protein [Anaerolineales bacterium]
MKYTDLQIQTQREFPNNMRSPGFGWLARAGYLTRENELTKIGQHFISHLKSLSVSTLPFPVYQNERAVYFPLAVGNVQILHCEACNFTEPLELAEIKKIPYSQEDAQALEKISTPNCSTIEALSSFLNLPKEKTAKALMFTRLSDGQFIFVVMRGDQTLSEAKLTNMIGAVKLATPEEIAKAGAVAGYASPIGLQNALIVVDDLIPHSPNLAAGANEAGFHFINANYGRDYSASLTADLTLAKEHDPCPACAAPLTQRSALRLSENSALHFENLMLALAETHHDEKGLTLPKPFAPFDVYLMHVPGKTLDTKSAAEEIYQRLSANSLSVLFDDRDERAGVKFNDADLLGCPLRVTVGEKALQNGMVELKGRFAKENQLVALDQLTEQLQ